MAATFSFTTTPILSGHSMRIYNTSTNWDQYVSGSSSTVTVTVTALDGGLVFAGSAASYVKSTLVPADLVGDFIIDLTSLAMFGVDEVIPDDIYNVKIDIGGSTTYTYNSDEVFYYNSWKTKSEVCYNAVAFIAEIDSTEIKYACMVEILYNGLIADIAIGNTSGIYEKVDIFNRISV